jgi:hypothetical protein
MKICLQQVADTANPEVVQKKMKKNEKNACQGGILL